MNHNISLSYVSGYAHELVDFLMTDVIMDAEKFQTTLHQEVSIPEPLSAQYVHPTKSEALAQYTTRFAKSQKN